jgi:hypothetical protein
MKAGRIVALVFGCIIGILGLGVLIAGIVGAVAYGVARDDDGFFRTDQLHLATSTAAITSDNLDLGSAPGDLDWLTKRGDFATVTLELRPTGAGGELFAGIGPTADVSAYLSSVAHDRVEDYDDSRSTVSYQRQDGSATPAPPGEQAFWTAQITSAEPEALTWDVESGDWTVVVMNADGSPGIDADARVGIKIDWLLPVSIGAIIVGFLLLVGGTLLAVFATRTPRRQPLPAGAGPSGMPPPPVPTAAPTTPAPPPTTGPPPTTEPPATTAREHPSTTAPPTQTAPPEHPRPSTPDQRPPEA